MTKSIICSTKKTVGISYLPSGSIFTFSMFIDRAASANNSVLKDGPSARPLNNLLMYSEINKTAAAYFGRKILVRS